MNTEIELRILIKESEFKADILPCEYFIEYFRDDFIKQLKKILKNVQECGRSIK